MDTAIKCLPVEVQGKLRSGVAIPSLQQCVEELILNSIDAEATCVGVRMDMEAFKVQVIDNGNGMDADSMGCVGNRYHTSKCHRVEDLDNLSWYGFRGEALASLVSLATLVEISSRTKSSLKTHIKIFKEGKGMEVYEAEKSRPSAGTTVVLCNFFYNMPVRRKRLDPVLEGERIRHRVEAISLMHPSVSFTLKNDCTATMLVQLPKAKSTYHRFVQIHGLHRAQKLGEVNFSHGRFRVGGHIGREGHYNNSSQFLYVNERLLLKTRIHKLINFLLRKPSTNQRNDDGEQSAVGSPKNKRSQELHGVYVLNIKCCCSEYDISLEPAKTLIEFKDWDGVLTCVEEAVKTFLKRENLTVVSQDEDSFNYKFLNINTADQERHVAGTGQQAVSNVPLTDYDIGMKLASDSVHRKSKTDGSFCAESGLMNCEEKTETEERTAHLEPVKSKEITSECGKEPQSDPLKLEPVCDLNNFGGKGAAFSNKPEEQLIIISEEEKNTTPNSTALPSEIETMNNYNIIKQMLPACQDTEKKRSNGKISLTDPYIHECLQAPDPSQINMSVHQQQAQLPTSKDEAFTFKRKLSLHPDCDRAWQTPTQDFPAVPLKIPKISSCPRVFLRKEPGSLEQFRRVYGKPENLKRAPEATSQRNAPLNDATGPLGAEKSSKGLCNPTLTVQVGGKKSLAAKLCCMKQHSIKIPQGMEHSSRTDSLQDGNNNSDPSFAALNPEPVPGRSANFQLSEEEESTTAGDWLLHYDTSLGKMVSVNKVTGLSRYEDRGHEETEVQCTSDITNMAVNVLSEMGMEYKCYPFQRDLVLPFVPKSRSARVINARLDGKGLNGSSSNSLTTLYSKWNNPVFVRPPTVGLDISRQQADGLTVKIHNVLYPYRFSKAMIHSMKVIHQVDKKFLACLISTKDSQTTDFPDSEGNLLVLVDQHAAHERVRLENLIADSYEDDPAAPGERRLCSSSILPPLEISVTEEELRLFRSFQPHLQRLGLEVKFPQAEEPQILVGKVPVCFTEKESNELRRGRLSVIRPIVEEYLQEQLDLLRSTGRVRGTLPLTVLKVLASLACHGAIKFNDSLSKDECHSLVASLSSCQLPFQCAHGRPSIAPLVDILHLDRDQKELQRPNLQKLRRMYKAWQLYGNK